MSAERAAVFGDELERAASALGSLPAVDRLAALGFDVLSRQAEGKSLYAGKKFAAGRAQAHGVKRNEADTPLGNVVAIVERGADGATQQALLAALFVRGFGDAVQKKPEERAALLSRFVEHCEWLELHAGQRVWPLLPPLLPQALVDEVHTALGTAALALEVGAGAAPALRGGASGARNSAAGPSLDPRSRARSAGRIALLSEANSDAARAALRRIASEHGDDFVRGLAALALGGARESSPAPIAGCSVRGLSGARRRSAPLALLAWVSGVALAQWLGQALAFAIGYRREVELSLRGDALRVRTRTQLLRRTIADEERVHPIEELRTAQRTARYPVLYAAVGTVCFALGVLLGGALGFDALRAGEPALLRWAALWLLVGSALDLALNVLVPASQSKVALDLDLGKGARAFVSAVPLADADRFIEALWQRLERGHGPKNARKDSRALA